MNFTHPFWRKDPLTEKETHLLGLVFQAHNDSALRGNISGNAVISSAIGSGDYSKSIASALMTIGGVHGPIKQTADLLQDENSIELAKLMIESGKKVPGWGNSFEKGHDDPIWANVKNFIWDNWYPLRDKIMQITTALHLSGKFVFPNPSTYTAATAIIVGLKPDCACYLFVAGRLNAWSSLFLNNKME